MPIDYEIASGVTIVDATVQLTGAKVRTHGVTLELWTPAGGELKMQLPARPTSATLDGKPLSIRRVDRILRARIPAGDHQLALTYKTA
jgi:hypothetical protein